jgi:predicted Zn-dependent peptidase
VHDWPHPRDYNFAPNQFTPPDPDASSLKTRSGVRAFVISNPADSVVRITVAFPLGRLYEQPGEEGASAVIADVLTGRGTEGVSRHFAQRLEALGLELNWFAGGLNPMVRPFSGEEAGGSAPPEIKQLPDGTALSIDVLPEDWRRGLELLVDIVRRPEFDDRALRNYRTGPGFAAPATSIGGNDFRPAIELERLLAGYPLAPPDAGLSVNPAALRALAARVLAPDRVVFGIGGDISRPEVEAALNELTSDWRSLAMSPLRAADFHHSTPAKRLHLIDIPSLQGWVAIGRVIDAVPEPEQPAVAILGEIVDTRLNIASREVRGLTNRDTLLFPETANGAGLVHARTSARPESIAPLIKLTLDEMARISAPDDQITDEELKRAQGWLTLGMWQGLLDGAGQASAMYAFDTVRRGGTKHLLAWPRAITAVTAAQVKDAARKYLKSSEMTTVVLGPIGAIRQARHPRWPVALDDLNR